MADNRPMTQEERMLLPMLLGSLVSVPKENEKIMLGIAIGMNINSKKVGERNNA